MASTDLIKPANQQTDFRWHDLINGPLFLLAGLSLTAYILMVAVLANIWFSPTGKNDQYAVLMPPWVDYKEAVAIAAKAEGVVIDMNRNTGIALMVVNHPDAVNSLYASGAWMVLDPEKLGNSGFGGLCISRPLISRPIVSRPSIS